jgi:hypothetical protein
VGTPPTNSGSSEETDGGTSSTRTEEGLGKIFVYGQQNDRGRVDSRQGSRYADVAVSGGDLDTEKKEKKNRRERTTSLYSSIKNVTRSFGLGERWSIWRLTRAGWKNTFRNKHGVYRNAGFM